MHVSTLCRSELFSAQSDGVKCTPEEVFPDWTRHDRLGVVMSTPMGAVGASNMIQLGVALSYEAAPSRRRDQYPPLFLFHLGGRFGDFSAMDVWPPRREVFLPADPYVLLGALTDRGITRLLLPEVPGVQSLLAVTRESSDLSWIRRSPSGWTDESHFREQLRSAYLYSPGGQAEHGEVVLRSDDTDCESMVEDVLEPHRCHQEFSHREDDALLEIGAGPSTVSDLRQWLEIFGARLDEVDARTRRAILDRRRADRSGRTTVQTYRGLSPDQALALFVRDGSPA